MKDTFAGIAASYVEITGTSKIVLLFILSVTAVVLLNDKENTDIGSYPARSASGRRIVHPAVFILSVWAGIAYAGTSVLNGRKKPVLITGAVLAAAMICLSGNIVFSPEYFELSSFYGTRPVIKILSLLCIFIYFCVYYLLSRQLFTARCDRMIFAVFSILLHVFAGYSERSIEFSLILNPINKPSVYIHDLMPFILLIYLIFEDKIMEFIAFELGLTEQVTELDDDGNEIIPEEWDMKKHRILNMRSLATAVAVIFIMLIVSVMVLNNKVNSLYEATVLLENVSNTKMTVDELKGADGNVDMVMMVSPEGTVVVVGGGDKASGTEAYELISKYTDTVDKWYLEGNGDNMRGAYDFCVDRGITVVETFVVKGVERLD